MRALGESEGLTCVFDLIRVCVRVTVERGRLCAAGLLCVPQSLALSVEKLRADICIVMDQLLQHVLQMPPVTRVYTVACVITTAATVCRRAMLFLCLVSGLFGLIFV